MCITFTYWITQRDSITSRKSFLNIRIKKHSSNFFNHTMTPNWHLKSFSQQLNYIFKALESVLSFFFFPSLDIHLRGLCGFFVWNRGHHALQETIFCCLEGKSFLSNHCRRTHLFMPAGNMTTDVVLNWRFNLMVWFLGPSSGVPLEGGAGDSVSPRRRNSWTPWTHTALLLSLDTSSTCKDPSLSSFHQVQSSYLPIWGTLKFCGANRCWLNQQLFLEAKLLWASPVFLWEINWKTLLL